MVKASLIIGNGNSIQTIQDINGNTTILNLINYGSNIDLINMYSSNYSETSNIAINFDNNYRVCVIDNDFQITKYNNIIDKDDYLLNLNNDSINIKNNNIVNNFNSNFVIKNDVKDIINIDNNINSIDFLNHNFNFLLTSNNFNLNNNDNNLFNCTSSNINISCDLYVNRILTEKIDSITGDGVEIQNLSIVQNNFNNVGLGNNLIDNTSEKSSNIPLVIDYNYNNSNIKQLLKLNKYYDTPDYYETILQINNNGYINIGNTTNTNENSMLYINNNSDNYLNHNNNLNNFVLFEGDYNSDKFTINKYGRLTIGDDTNKETGLININRNDDRINLDLLNSNNINRDLPLLNLNIDYETKNNYIWETSNYNYYFKDVLEIQNSEYSYTNNYSTLFSTGIFSGLSWKYLGTTRPPEYTTPLTSFNDDEFKEKLYNSVKQDNIITLDVSDVGNNVLLDLGYKHYLEYNKDGENYYYTPNNIYRKNIYYNYDNTNYYFFHSLEINKTLNYDYKKLKLNESNNKNVIDDPLQANRLTLNNVLYDVKNLQYNTAQIEYEFKTFEWKHSDNKSDNILFYPDKINIDDKTYKLKIEEMNTVFKPDDKSNNLLLYNIDEDNIDNSNKEKDLILTNLQNYLKYEFTVNDKKLEFKDLLYKRYSNISDDSISSNFNTKKSNFLEEYSVIRHIKVYASGRQWKRMKKTTETETETEIKNITDIWDEFLLLDAHDRQNPDAGSKKTKLQQEINKYNDTLPDNMQLIKMENTDLLNLLKQKGAGVNIDDFDFGLSQNELDNLNIDYIYCNHYLEDDDYYYYPDEKITAVFNLYYKKNNIDYRHNISSYINSIINKPNFINLTSNNMNILNIDYNGTINYNNNNANNSNYSLYAPDKIISTNKIEINEIVAKNNYIDFNNSLLSNISSIQFNDIEEFFIPKLNVNSILNDNNDITFNNCKLSLNYDNTFNNTSNYLLYDETYNKNYDYYYNNILNFDLSHNNNVRPAITIYGDNPSFILKTDTNNSLLYQQTIANKKFNNLSSDGLGNTEIETFQINYYNQNNDILDDNNFYTYNTQHLIEHIGGTYDIFSIGQNYNICIDMKGVTSNHQTYTNNIANNSTNKSHSVSIGIPHNNNEINTDGTYLYNYPTYFHKIITSNDYMLNIFGNTKIAGIDGDTNAMSVVINDQKSSDNTYKVNVGIAIEPKINNFSNTLSIGGDLYADNIFYKTNQNYDNIINISNNVVTDFKNNLFKEELTKSVIHTSNINNNFVNDNGIFNLNLIPKIPLTNFSNPDKPTREIIYYNLPKIVSEDDDIAINTLDFKKGSTNIYTAIDDLKKITDEFNKYHYIVLKNNKTDYVQHEYTITANDSLTYDTLIVGGGGGGGYVKPLLKWYLVENSEITENNLNEFTVDDFMKNDLLNSNYSFTESDFTDTKRKFTNQGTEYAGYSNISSIFSIENSYIKIAGETEETHKYYKTYNNAGGEGGDVSLITNKILNKDETITLKVGKKGLVGIDSNNSTNGMDSELINNDRYIAYGGKNSQNYNNQALDIDPNTAINIYNMFSIYEEYGINNNDRKYFGGDGNNTFNPSHSFGGGGGSLGVANAIENTGGGGGYYDSNWEDGANGNWGDGANGIVIMRYKYNLKDEKITDTIDNPSNGLLQYNWTNSNWQLNYDITDSSNDLIYKINETSNILNNKIDVNSNSIIETTNLINTEILTSNNLLYSYIDNVSNILRLNDNNISNYINNVYNTTTNIGAERIVSNILDVDRIPLLPFTKFSNFDIDYIESPKINNEVIIGTDYYESNIHINNADEINYYEYIILKHNSEQGNTQNQTKYNLYFQVPSVVDILIVGGGGAGKGRGDFCGGGGGGGVIIAKNVNIELNKNYEITVGKGGHGTDGSYSSAFNLTAHGGKGGTGGDPDNQGLGGIGGQTDISDTSLINGGYIVHKAGGNGGTITDANNFDSAIEGVESDIINNGSENNKTYRWGGGGGYSSSQYISSAPNGGSGGGGGGAFISDGIKSKTGTNYFNINEEFTSTTDSLTGNGLSGIDGTGGGGGASFGLNTIGGDGGDGIVIIKIKSKSDIIDNKKKKGYISYNFNINKWEMNSLDLINLDIDYDLINQNITDSSNNLINYVNTTLQTQEFGYIIVPSNFVTSSSIVNGAIHSYNIFGYMGKSYDLEENSGLQADANGLITIPDTGYTDTNSPYYKHLLKGNKFSQGSITNDNIANNSITADKLQGTISGDKLALSSINYNDITGSIQGNVTILNDGSSGSLIDISTFNDITLDISLLDLTSSAEFSGLTTITSQDNLIKIPVNKFSNINLDINDINFSENYGGVTTIISDSTDINLGYFEKINLNISNLLNFGSSDFVLPEAYIDGIIDKNYINNLYIYSSNINESTLLNTNVILIGDDKISPSLIYNLNLSAKQIDDDGTQDKLINVTLNLDGGKINPNLLKDVQIRPSEIEFIPNALNASIITLESDKINPNLLSQITIKPNDLSNIDNYSIKLSNVTLDTSTDKLNPNIISSLTITPDDLSNIDNYSIKLNNVYIDTSTTLLNPNLIGNITLSPEQFNTAGAFQSVTLSSLDDESINPSLINQNSIIVEARHLKLTDDNGNYYKLPTNLTYEIPDYSIAPTLIPDNVIIYGSNIDISSGDKLDIVTIKGEISSTIFGSNVTLSSDASIIDNGKISGTVLINGNIDSKLINNAIINDGCNIQYTGTKIDSTIIYGNIDSSLVGNAYVYINSGNFTTITGESTFSGTTTITGEVDAKYINNAIIDLTETNTSLTEGSHISGDVTIIGVVDASHINPDTSVKINIENGQFNGSNIADESIPYTKLSSNLYLYVNEIIFSNGTSFTSAIPDDIYTKTEIDTDFVSKQYYTSDISAFYNSDNLLNIKVNNNSTLTEQILPIYNSNISTNNTFIYSQDDNTAFISVKSKQDNALIQFNSSNITNINNIGNKSIWNDGGFMQLNSERCSFILNSENVIEFANTSNFSHKPLYVPQIIFADGTNMNTYVTPILNDDKQIIMNNTESGYTYSDSQITGEGFIHCNGLHAEFDITAFSSTTKSDINLKKDVKQLEYNNELLYLNPVTFKWKDINKSNSSNVGFIAQEIEEILPNLVKEGLDNYKSVNYVSLIPYLVKHIQNLEKRIVFLEENIKST